MLEGPLPKRGLLMIESKLGWMVSDSTPVLLTDNAEVAYEVERILSTSYARAPAPEGWSPSGVRGDPGSSHAREDFAGE